MSAPQSPPRGIAPWRKLLDFERQDGEHYLDFVNTPLLGLVEGAPRRVLDLGCATGALGAELKRRHAGCVVVGIEAGRAAAARAASRLDRVIEARIEAVDFAAPDLAAEPFDAVIAADVLEHLVNPWDALERLRACLTPGAQLLASIPNARNIWLINRLLTAGRWEYTERGLLDVSHLRFFTRTEIDTMLRESGFVPQAWDAIILPALVGIHASHKAQGAPVIKLPRLTLTDITPEEVTELCAEQWLVRARLD